MEEMDSRLIPWDPAELAWQHRRPKNLWTPLPPMGSHVFYRNEHWGEETDAEVIGHQDEFDYKDHYLWHVVRSESGYALTDELGRYVLEKNTDPWVTLTLVTDWGKLTCREARVRGSAGWLPLDWTTRYRPNPLRNISLPAGIL